MMRLLTPLPRMSTADIPESQTLGVYLQADDDGVEIMLHGFVGDEYTGTDSGTLAQTLSQNRGKPVTLRVNSPGGLAYDGVAIYNAIASHDGPTTGIIEGMAGSAASLAVIAADTVKSYPSGQFVPHYAIGLAYGHQSDLRDALTRLEKLDAEVEQIYAERSGQDLGTVRKQLLGPEGDGTQFSAKEAMEAGYVDEIIELKKKGKTPKYTTTAALHQMRLRLLDIDSLPNRL